MRYHNLSNGGARQRAIANVRRHMVAATAHSGNGRGDLLQTLGLAGDDHDTRAPGSDHLAVASPNARGAARDQNGLRIEVFSFHDGLGN
jgi:hypothetical protein